MFQLFFLLTVLKLAPFLADDDDTSSFSSSLSITLTCLLGFAMTLGSSSEYDAVVLGEILVAIGTANILFELFIMVRGEYRVIREARRAKKIGNTGVDEGGSTKVLPAYRKSEEKAEERAQKMWSTSSLGR